MSLRTLLAGLLAAAACSAPARAEPPMWTVRDADSKIVLFGSVHMLPPELKWRTPALDKALAGADDLWFEIPVDDAGDAQAAQAAMSAGMLPSGQTLSSRLSLKGAERLARHAGALGLSLPALEQMRPWLADVSLSTAVYMRAGALSASGVENQVSQRAPRTAERRAFETPAQQIGFLASAPEAEQVAGLEETLRELDESPNAYDDLVVAWLSGDIDTLEREAVAPMRKASPGLYRRMVADRNARWVEAIKARMAGAGDTVVVVGVGHLVGPDGLPTRLRALGYQVDGP